MSISIHISDINISDEEIREVVENAIINQVRCDASGVIHEQVKCRGFEPYRSWFIEVAKEEMKEFLEENKDRIIQEVSRMTVRAIDKKDIITAILLASESEDKQ